MLENPNFVSTLNEALSNPQVIDQMIRSNPMLRDMGPQVRQMMQDPGFRRMMTDPEALRNLSQMQRQFGGGGMGGMFGGAGGGNEAFPAPGVTDTTEDAERTATHEQTDSTPQAAPNPFAMFGNPAAGAGGAGAGAGAGATGNPFAALFGPGGMGAMGGNPPTYSPATGGAQAPGANPQQGANPMASMAQNMMRNPQMMQQMMQAMGGGAGGMGGEQPPTANHADPHGSAAGAGFNPFAALQALGMGGGMGGPGLGTPPPPEAPRDDRPPEDRYAEQLRQLNDMGFYEFERNIEALRRTGGSVQGAVEYLLTH